MNLSLVQIQGLPGMLDPKRARTLPVARIVNLRPGGNRSGP